MGSAENRGQSGSQYTGQTDEVRNAAEWRTEREEEIIEIIDDW